MKRYILIALVLCVLVGVASAWGASMGAWDYRKEITLNNTGAELTDYQVMFTVNRSAGSDSGFTVYLDGKCEEDYDDIRFTTGENTLCDYWIESSSSSTAIVWVEVPTITAGNTQLYLYYGNPSATSFSNGDATFPIFDDFSGTTLNTTTWSVLSGNGNVYQSDGTLHLDYSGSQNNDWWTSGRSGTALRPNSLPLGTFEAVVTLEPYPVNDYSFAGISAYNSDTSAYMFGRARYGTNWNNIQLAKVGQDNIASQASTTLPAQLKIQNTSSGYSFWADIGSQWIQVGSSYSDVPLTAILLFGKEFVSNDLNPVFDDFFIRNYVSQEPTISTWGSEEQFHKYLTIDFSGVPTSGYVPLTVYFTDASVGYNVTLDTWAWSFGDTSQNSTQQNPAHTYTTSGLYNVILTVTNTSFSKTNTTQKTAYINVTVNPDAPNADFTVTELCGSTSDTFYFIDYSTGGGLYAWNWSFGDGSYSELRNPTHQYASNGTYSVNLSVWGAYGFDSLLRENLITIPCGAATPTPTPTVTPTGTPTATGPVPTAEVNETAVGETWIRWVWEDPGEPVDIYIDGAKVESWVNNTTQAYRLTGLNPSERHVLSLYRAGNATLIDQQDVTTLPATWLIVSVLAISIFFAVCTILSRDIYRVLLCSTIACVSSGFLAMIGVGHPWGITIIGIIVALITGVIAVIVALDLRNGDEDE